MKNYKSIKELVVDTYITEGGFPSEEKLDALVKNNFPKSKWQKSHYSWYKSQIKTGKIQTEGRDGIIDKDLNESECEDDIVDSFETKISIERDLRDYIVQRLEEIETGLRLYENGVEYKTGAGRIDVLATDDDGVLVVIELKAGKAKDAALGQILGYIGSLYSEQEKSEQIRGILVASDFEQRVVYTAENLSNISLVRYQVSFGFNKV